MRRTLARVGAALLCLIAAGYLGHQLYLAHVIAREAAAPSTEQLLVMPDGRQIPLLQPTLAGAAVVPAPARPTSPGAQGATPAAEPLPPGAVADPALPPERIIIPSIDADWPVVLTTVDHLPRFRGVGWLMGSAWPGATGNIVLFGHRGGEAGTFMRLPELRPGDAVSIVTRDTAYQYRVRSSFETTPDDVAVMAPADTPIATLITCTGPWDPVAATNTHRLIVVADLIADQPAGGQP